MLLYWSTKLSNNCQIAETLHIWETMWVIKLVYVVLSLNAIKYQKRPLLSYFFSPYKLLRDTAVQYFFLFASVNELVVLLINGLDKIFYL